jgi:hypothetical protein
MLVGWHLSATGHQHPGACRRMNIHPGTHANVLEWVYLLHTQGLDLPRPHVNTLQSELVRSQELHDT